MHTALLVLTSVGSVLLLLFLVMKARLHAFVALILVSIGAGIFSGMPPEKIADTLQKGMGGTLGFLAIVVALDQIAQQLLSRFGEKNAHIALGFAGLICTLPLFFDVAIVLLIGIVFAVAERTKANVVSLAVPHFAGVAASAAFLVPGPTAMLVASQMQADFGWMIVLGLAAAIPGMLLAGPVFGRWISRHVSLPIPADVVAREHYNLPSIGVSVGLVLLPLLLVGLKTIAARFGDPTTALYQWLQLIDHPFCTILLACLLAIYGLGVRHGMSRDRLMDICSAALQPAGIILLVTGAGGVFKQVLVDSGVGPALGDAPISAGLPIALPCFVLAAAVRLIQGSATVACLTTVGLVLPVIDTLDFSGAQRAALSICIAGGSIVLSHVNDSGFWLFGRFTGANEAQTLKTWSLMETILGTTGAIVGMIAFVLV